MTEEETQKYKKFLQDELTAIVKRGGSDFWQVYGQAKLHMLKGLPEAQFSHGQEIRF